MLSRLFFPPSKTIPDIHWFRIFVLCKLFRHLFSFGEWSGHSTCIFGSSGMCRREFIVTFCSRSREEFTVEHFASAHGMRLGASHSMYDRENSLWKTMPASGAERQEVIHFLWLRCVCFLSNEICCFEKCNYEHLQCSLNVPIPRRHWRGQPIK